MFPYHKSGDTSAYHLDYYLDEVLNATGYWDEPMIHPDTTSLGFDLVDFQMPKAGDVFNFDSGNAFAIFDSFNKWCGYSDIFFSSTSYDTIRTKIIIDSTHEQYVPGIYGADIPLDIDSVMIDTTILPEEIQGYEANPYIYFYQPDNTSFCYKSPLYTLKPNLDGAVEWCPEYLQFKIGLGIIRNGDRIHCPEDEDPFGEEEHWQLTSTNKGGASCGPEGPLQLPAISSKLEDICIYPNPANEDLIITAKDNQAGDCIAIFNIQGQTIFKSSNTNLPLKVNTTTFGPGFYLVRVITPGGMGYDQKVLIEH